MYTNPKKMAARFAENMKPHLSTKRRTKPDCLNGYGDGPAHCTLEVGHNGQCNHLQKASKVLP